MPKTSLPGGLQVKLSIGVGRITEPTFTGVLWAALVDPIASPHVIKGLGVSGTVTAVFGTVTPIDLVVASFANTTGSEHLTAIEVKWRGSPSNSPGYKSAAAFVQDDNGDRIKDDQGNSKQKDIWWPPQIDRAHQSAEARTCLDCHYPNACEHTCPRCQVGNNDQMQLPEYREGRSLSEIGAKYPKAEWDYVFIDYAGRAPEDAYMYSDCYMKWKAVAMYDLSQSLQAVKPLPSALEPIIAAIHSPA
jgi:radical SAM protein with 4Fe4S-binding SPASM domain